jgi:ABC-type dipeptide/oligopeptide/nickel transport system ATPase subunit
VITRLEIEGYRGLQGCKLAPLAKFNLIVGAGNSGKTSILEALLLFASEGNTAVLASVLGSRGIKSEGRTPEELSNLLTWSFDRESKTDSSTLSGQWRGDQRKVTIRRVPSNLLPSKVPTDVAGPDLPGVPQLGRPTAIFEIVSEQRGRPRALGRLYVTKNGLANEQGADPPFVARLLSAGFRGSSQKLAPEWTKTEDAGDAENVLELLRVLDPDVKGLKIAATPEGQAYVRLDHGRLGQVPLEFMGAGFVRALGIASTLVAAADGVLLIDEIDASMHIGGLPLVIKFVLEAARRHRVQVFATTHDLETVDAFLAQAQAPDEMRILRLARPPAADRIINFSVNQARELREQVGLDLRQA